MEFAPALNPCSTLALTNFSHLRDFWKTLSCTRSRILWLRFRLCTRVRRSFILRSMSREMCYICSLFWEQSQVEVRKKKKKVRDNLESSHVTSNFFYKLHHMFMNFMHFYTVKFIEVLHPTQAVIAWSNSCLSAVYTVNTSLTSTISGRENH